MLNVNGANDNANTALGYLSGTNISTGTKNVAIGADSGGDLSTGDYNTIIGHTAAPNGGGDGENQIVIGYHVTGKGDNTATIGNGDCTDVYMAEDVGATVHCAGINFSATQPAPDAGSSSSEVLDGYEEGSWTPVITDGSNNATMSGTYNAGLYTKVGRVVHLTGYVVSTSLGSVSGDIKISGLPFTVKNAFGAISGGAVSTGGGLAITAGHSVTVGVAINTTTLTLKVSDATTGTTNMQHSEWTDDGNIGFSITYFV